MIKATSTAIILSILMLSPVMAAVSMPKGIETMNQTVTSKMGHSLKSEEIKAKIQEICQAESDDKLNFEFTRLGSSVLLPGNCLSWKVTPNSDNELGMRLFALEADTDAGLFRQLIQVNITKTIEAAELCQLVKPGEVITEDMVKTVPVVVKNEKNNKAVPYRFVIGRTMGNFKSAGSIIRHADLKKASGENLVARGPKATRAHNIRTAKALNMMAATVKNDLNKENWVVKPGDSVEFRVNSGALSLSIPAKAVQGGYNGDEIQLINLKNKRRITGVITEKGVVEYAQK